MKTVQIFIFNCASRYIIKTEQRTFTAGKNADEMADCWIDIIKMSLSPENSSDEYTCFNNIWLERRPNSIQLEDIIVVTLTLPLRHKTF